MVTGGFLQVGQNEAEGERENGKDELQNGVHQSHNTRVGTTEGVELNGVVGWKEKSTEHRKDIDSTRV